VRRTDPAERQTVVLGAPAVGGGARRTRYGTPPAAVLAGLTVVLPLVAFVLLLTGRTVAAAALALVAFVLAIMFGPETRQSLRLWSYAAWEWGSTGTRVAGLRLERLRSKRRLDGALRELGSATYDHDDERIGLAEARARDAGTALAHACDEEARLVEKTRTRVEERRRRT
jgi:hypothetical protein